MAKISAKYLKYHRITKRVLEITTNIVIETSEHVVKFVRAESYIPSPPYIKLKMI